VFEWIFKSKPKSPVKTWVENNALYFKYKTIYNHDFEVSVYPDVKVPGTFIIKSNSLEIGRVGVSDDGSRLIISGTVAPPSFLG
jgi:hypothetical protein